MSEASTSTTSKRRIHLEDQLEFLLTSIADLDVELEVGDLEVEDHQTLTNDYIRRAAGVRRQLDRLHKSKPPQVGRVRRSSLVMVAGTIGLACLAGFFVAQAAGTRSSTDTATGGLRASSRSLVAEAHEAEGEQRFDDAIAIYTEALELAPSDVEALTYRGWNRFLTGDLEAASDDLADAVLADEDYPDARAFRAIIAGREDRHADVLTELDILEASNPPPGILQLVSSAGLRDTATITLLLDEARVASDAGEVIEALDAYAEVLDIDPGSYEALIGRAWIGAQPGLAQPAQFEALLADSLALLDRAVEVRVGAPQAHGLRAVVRSVTGDLDGAAADLTVVDGAPTDPDLEQVLESTGVRSAIAAAR